MSHARGKSIDYNEAKLRQQKWTAANRVVKKAMRHRRAALQSLDCEAAGDCTQTLLRMLPGQGMLPDGSAGGQPSLHPTQRKRLHVQECWQRHPGKCCLGSQDAINRRSQLFKEGLLRTGFSMLKLCKAVLMGVDAEASAAASKELSALTVEDICAKIGRLAQAQAARSASVPSLVLKAQRLLKQECDRLAACLPSALGRWGTRSFHLSSGVKSTKWRGDCSFQNAVSSVRNLSFYARICRPASGEVRTTKKSQTPHKLAAKEAKGEQAPAEAETLPAAKHAASADAETLPGAAPAATSDSRLEAEQV